MLVIGVAVARTPSQPAIAEDLAPGGATIASRINVSATLGYSYPTASTERGGETRDVSWGMVPLSLSGSYDLDRHWSGIVRVLYAPNIPTWCAGGSDCFSSVGRDVWMGAGIGRTLPGWRRVTPQLELEIGWEWFTSKLSDSGVVSARSWNGPLGSLGIFVNLRSEGSWSVGPTASIGMGIFSRYDVDTPAWRSGGATDPTIHAWPTLGFRVGHRL